MDIGIHAAPIRAISLDLTAATRSRTALAIAALSGIGAAAALFRPGHAVNPGARAALETTITLAAIFSAGLFTATFRRRGQLLDLLLLCALLAVSLADFVHSAAAWASGGVGLESDTGAGLDVQLIASLSFAAAAFAPRKAIPGVRGARVAFAVAAGAGAFMLAELLTPIVGSNGDAGASKDAGIAGAANHPVALAVHTVSAAILIVSALAFLIRSRPGAIERGLLAGASLLLAGASLQYLVMPVVAAEWVTPGGGLRLAAYALLLATACGRYAKTTRYEVHDAISSERERISRDLHDGLAQDLACIAAQGQRLGCELGPEHPLMVATRHALAAARGAIADLIASSAPSTEAALRLIADDLEHRYGVHIQVRIESEAATSPTRDLDPPQRENLVRIAREAIVNAALHGTARHVDVVLLRRGRDLLLRVSDDGSGIAATDRSGFGLRTMRARAASLGGQLSAHARPGGGTELELLVP
ncbi:MAG: hypothetical protein JOZ98_00210 [Solirubrobacterales bacterium]|nr:hypothetical protein [Solirubrobacterales bacterium]